METEATPNTTLSRDVLETELGRYGRAYGQGQNSRPAAALRCLEAATKLSNVGPDDAKDLYTKFQTAAAKARGLEYAAESSFTVQVSKLKRFLMLGTLPKIDGVGVMQRAVDRINEMAGMAENPLKGSAYDNMVNIARRQIEQPDHDLTDEQIMETLNTDTPEKSNLDKVIDAYKKTYRLAEKLAEEGVDVTKIDEAKECLADQIKSMDGELPPMTKAEKQKAAAFKVLKSQGIEVVAI